MIELRKILLESLGLSREAMAEVDKVLAIPEVESILACEDSRDLDRRRELVSRLEACPAKYSDRGAAAAKDLVAASKALAKANADLSAAITRETEACLEVHRCDLTMSYEQGNLIRELKEGRDRRLDDLFRFLGRAHDQARNAIRSSQSVENNRLSSGRLVKHWSNGADVLEATTVILALQSEVSDLTLAAVSREAMTQRLTDVCRRAQRALDPLHLAGPAIDERGEVKEASPFHLHSSLRGSEKVAASG